MWANSGGLWGLVWDLCGDTKRTYMSTEHAGGVPGATLLLGIGICIGPFTGFRGHPAGMIIR